MGTKRSDFRKDLKKAAYKYPYYKLIADYHAKNKEIKESIKLLQDYLKIEPNCADAHFWIADRSFYSKGYNWGFTEEHYKKAVELAPENPYYKYWYAIHLTYRGRYHEANNLFNKILKIDPDYTERISKFKKRFLNPVRD